MERTLGHLAAHMKDFTKNGSQIKIFKFPQILMKIANNSILVRLSEIHFFQHLNKASQDWCVQVAL